jgi:twinkle protein
VRRRGIKILVVDPYNRLEHHIAAGVNESTYISGQLDKMTAFAQREGVLLILVAHPRKMERDPATEHKVPTLYDINGSANFFNKADYGICVHRIRSLSITQVHVQKVKFRHLGEVGVANFRYNVNNGRYVPALDSNNEKERVAWDNANYLTGGIGQRLAPQQQALPVGKELAVGPEKDEYEDFIGGGISAEQAPF